MLFILLFCIFTNIHSKLLTYTLYQTNNICLHNWKESICLPIFSFNKTNQPLLIKLDINNQNPCPTQTLVYIRTRQCIYCSKHFHHIHCHHQRLRRMIPIEKDHIHRNHLAIISLSLFGILILGSLFTLFIIKRSQARTNLLELYNPEQNSNPNIKLPTTIKSIHMNQLPSTHLTIPTSMKTRK